MYEHELKFKVRSLTAIEQRLRKLGGKRKGTRHEENYFFHRRGWLLRLRTEPPELTLKGPVRYGKARSGLEFNVPVPRVLLPFLRPVFNGAHHYAKRRTSYVLRGVKIELDSLEFGTFVEIEGRPDAIRAVQGLLGLRTPVKDTYSAMAERKNAASRTTTGMRR